MTSEHPFHTLFESFGRLPSAHAEPVNRAAFERLCSVLSAPLEHAGRCVLLSAPRAGHGKTHLLSRVQHRLGGSHEFIPVHAVAGTRVDGTTVLADALRGLARPLPAAGGLCGLDLVARRLFALALHGLVQSGEVPCQDREAALAALRLRPVETFDFHHPTAVTAHWARDSFEALGPRMVLELSQATGSPVTEIGFWVEWLFRGSVMPPDHPGRFAGMAEAALGSAGEALAMERLAALLGLISLLGRVVLVADDLEVFSMDDGAALRLAGFFGTLRQSVERLDVIISLNQDIWETAFVPRLSGGLADRLSEVVVELEPLGHEEMVALLESRVPGLGERVLAHIDLERCGGHARGVMRAAAQAWQDAQRADAAAMAAPVMAEQVPFLKPQALAESPPMVRFEPMPPAVEASVEVPARPQVAITAEVPDASWPPPTFEPVPEIPPTPLPEPVHAVDPSSVFAPTAPAAVPFQPFASFSAVEEFPPAAPEPVFASGPSEEAWQTATAPSSPFGLPPDEGPSPFSLPPGEGPAPRGQAEGPPHDTDRVDDLLRQFRERYGRGGL